MSANKADSQPSFVEGDPLGEMIDFSGAPRSMGEKRDFAFKIMKQRMIEITAKRLQNVSPLVRSTALKWYEQGMNEAFYVFAQVTEQDSDEEFGGV